MSATNAEPPQSPASPLTEPVQDQQASPPSPEHLDRPTDQPAPAGSQAQGPQPGTTVTTETTVPAPPKVTDHLVTTEHSVTTPSGELRYTVRAGRVVLGEEEVTDDVFGGWKPKAEMSITAYTLADGDVLTRPITFVFNGGPGSSSVWMHMGLLGPRRVEMGDAGELAPPPYGLADNPQTLLAESDLVFIDPMSTGHTRAVEGTKAKDYHGFAKDVEQVAEFIRLWCTREDRWMSPKFLCGESYGTVRAVAVADRLAQRHMMALNGLILISSVLDFSTQDFELHQHDITCADFLPSYAAIAWYHGRHGGRELRDVLAEAEEFADGRYRWALMRGNRLTADERADVVATLARLTGLSERYVDLSDLRIEHIRFCTELLRDERQVVGRIDGRFTAPAHSGVAEMWQDDASLSAMTGPYAAAMHHYLRGELGSEQELSYEIFGSAIREWSYAEFEGKPICVTDKLERLMRINPHLQVRVEYGYYDLATPYYSATDTMAHLRLPAGGAERIEHSFFETGHMPYLHEESRLRESAEIAAFVRRASNR